MDFDFTLDRVVAERLDLTKPVVLRYENEGHVEQAPATITRWVDIGQRVGVTFSIDENYAFLLRVGDEWLDGMLLMMHDRDGQAPPTGPSKFVPSPEGWSPR